MIKIETTIKIRSYNLFLKLIKKNKIEIKRILLKNEPTTNSSPNGPDSLP